MRSEGVKAQFETADGKRLNEHQEKTILASQGSCPSTEAFLEIENDVEFEVHIHMVTSHQVRDDWHYIVTMDGRRISKKVRPHDKSGAGPCVVHSVKEAEGRKVYAKKLKFAQVPTVETKGEENITPEGRTNLGRIEIVLQRGYGKRLKDQTPRGSRPTVGAILETDQKAKVASFVSTGSSRPVPKQNLWSFTPFDGDYYRFTYSYLTRAALIFRNIIDDPAPEPLSTPAASSVKTERPATRQSTLFKRKRDAGEIIDLSVEGDEDAEDEAARLRKRVKFLEERNARLAREVRKGRQGDLDVVDLSFVEEDA